jgi:hypothetical protein
MRCGATEGLAVFEPERVTCPECLAWLDRAARGKA